MPYPLYEEFHIRIPKTLAATIRKMAEDNCRSVTKQIEYLVKQAMQPVTFQNTRG